MNPWLHRFAVLTALATLVLVGIGGLVTSHGAGMAVPDWPNSYGYNMFTFPVSMWVGGILYEHSHRLAGSVVGFLTLVLALWLNGRPAAKWLRWGSVVVLALGLAASTSAKVKLDNVLFLVGTGGAGFAISFFWPQIEPISQRLARFGLLALVLVIVQGVLGGLRVTALADWLGIFHGTLAQCFLVLVCAIALVTSGWWARLKAGPQPVPVPAKLRNFLLVTTLLILGQLALGASMRHQHAGLAVPDFPLAHGKVWPVADAASLEAYNAARNDHREFKPITAGQIHLHMAHRVGALIVFGHVLGCLLKLRRTVGGAHPLARGAAGWFALICLQFGLGVWTVWSNKAADIATLHVIVGAASLVTGALLTLLAATVWNGHSRAAPVVQEHPPLAPAAGL
ncbi:MAG: COX15/CtaA family protein [Verrucomicrobia bacterium]|nr:COX15/CtaA family protein [Verrucomicrobiota bacterium]